MDLVVALLSAEILLVVTVYRVISLAGAATKHVFCRDKSMLVATDHVSFSFSRFRPKIACSILVSFLFVCCCCCYLERNHLSEQDFRPQSAGVVRVQQQSWKTVLRVESKSTHAGNIGKA